MIRITIATLGCKTNQVESDTILDQFNKAEIQIVPWNSPADIYIINTCTVTNRTDYKSRYLIRQALACKALNPLARVVVTGCFAQRSYEEIKAMGAIDFIVDNQQKLSLASLLEHGHEDFHDIMSANEFNFKPLTRMQEHTRAFQKIQDGCDFYCAYCAVPYGRGHNRSARLEDVLQQARLFAQNGHKEIVLGGVNLGLYRDGEHHLADVVEAMAEIKGLELIRLSSLEPQLISSDLLRRLKAIPQFCPHLHIALQSGSDAILQSMGRHYLTSEVRRLVDELLSAFPDIALGFDVITGFPGETEALHQETYRFIESLPLAYLHVFSYSKREGTPAAAMPEQVPKPIKNHRTNELLALATELNARYRDKLLQLNPILRGIVEAHHAGKSEFLSDHFLRIRIPKLIPLGDLALVSAQDAEPLA